MRTLVNRAFDFSIRVITIDGEDWFVQDDFLKSINTNLRSGPATSFLKNPDKDSKLLKKDEHGIKTRTNFSSFITVNFDGLNDMIDAMPNSEIAQSFGKWIYDELYRVSETSTQNVLARILSYDGNCIEINDKGMWNATQMAKPFGKQASKWFENSQTKEFINEISKSNNLLMDDLVKVTKGGNVHNSTGTWIHEKLVIDFAQWLNVKFRVWCNTQIETLMREGKIELAKPESLLDWMKLAVANEEKRLALEKENKRMRPVVEYHDTVLKSKGTYTTTQIAKELGISSAEKLNKILHDKHIQYKSGKQWVLYSNYCGNDYTDTITSTFDMNGTTFSNAQTVWTEKGRKFIHELFENERKKELCMIQ